LFLFSKKWDRQAHVIVFMLNAILMMNRAKNKVEGSKKILFYSTVSPLLQYSNNRLEHKEEQKKISNKKKKRKEKEMKRIVNGMSWI
jgi:hypothetical protein